jgi:SAM-dependent methyltransferase
VEPWLAATYRSLVDPPPPNLLGDRDVEYTWIQAHIPEGPGLALEFGSGGSPLWLAAVRHGFKVTGIDLQPATWFVEHPAYSFVQSDLFALDLPQASLDLVINCSTVEHVGLNRYGARVDRDGDLAAMRRLHELLKPGGTMLLTIPVGQDAVIAPLHRVYGQVRLPLLLDGYESVCEEFWMKDPHSNRWQPCTSDLAYSQVSSPHLYALGCFVLSRSTRVSGPPRLRGQGQDE